MLMKRRCHEDGLNLKTIIHLLPSWNTRMNRHISLGIRDPEQLELRLQVSSEEILLDFDSRLR
jgi:hypothetical protein